MKCAKCGAEIRTGCVYCSNCGEEAQIVTEINVLEDDLLRSMLEESDKEKVREEDQNEKSDSRTSERKNSRLIKQKKYKQTVLVFIVIIAAACCALLGFGSYRRNHSVDYLMEKANQAYAQKDYQESLDYLERLTRVDPDYESALLLQGEIYAAMKDTEQAEQLFLRVIELNPSNSQAYERLLELYDQQGEYEKIVALQKQASDEEILKLFQAYIVQPPVIDKESGFYSEFFEVSIEAAADVDIYYTLDGSTPSKSSSLYRGVIEISEQGETVLKAVCLDRNGNYSEVAEAVYEVELMRPDMPGVTPDGGQFTEEQAVTVTVPRGVTVYYTWDDTTPTTRSKRYTGPITIPEGNNILSLIAVDSYGMQSEVMKCNYIYYPQQVDPDDPEEIQE